MYLFFDTETTGLPGNWRAPVTDLNNWPRIIQIAWMLCDEQGNEIERFCNLIYPAGWKVPTDDFWIKHGYSQEKSEREGIAIGYALQKFIDALERSKYLVAHNMDFDQKVTSAEFIRANLKTIHRTQKICTKTSATDFCKIPGPHGYKWPSLEELHKKLFGTSVDGAHDAFNDVVALKNCFFELKKLKVI
ncbi:MAG TPA: 3'-5' exonuclease [Bacteroidia bacterium]|nr:3'-5' exonuclease [Bacteroidia bacterium]